MSNAKKTRNDAWLAAGIVIAILVVDQIIKIAVKTHMCLGETIEVTDWFFLDFVENRGMAFGMTFIPKVALSLFRIVAVAVIAWYISKVVRREHRTRYVVFLSMILAGAAGNIIDCMFYGLIFSPSGFAHVAQFVPFGEGYASFLTGKVVDMFYFPLIVSSWPEWMPFIGGNDFVFFSPVFNFADASISVGVILLLLFSYRDFQPMFENESQEAADEPEEAPEIETKPEE